MFFKNSDDGQNPTLSVSQKLQDFNDYKVLQPKRHLQFEQQQ
jgi:hypothetical protein